MYHQDERFGVRELRNHDDLPNFFFNSMVNHRNICKVQYFNSVGFQNIFIPIVITASFPYQTSQ